MIKPVLQTPEGPYVLQGEMICGCSAPVALYVGLGRSVCIHKQGSCKLTDGPIALIEPAPTLGEQT